MEINHRTEEDFFDIIKYFKKANYKQKVAFMKEHWGDIRLTTKLQYSNGCSITIGFDENNKYYFDFDCEQIDFAEFEKYLPEYAEAMICLGPDELLKKCPELTNLDYIEKITENPELLERPIDDTALKVDYNYLNAYRGINLSKNTKK